MDTTLGRSGKRTLPDYDVLAKELGVEVCDGPPLVDCPALERAHNLGFVKADKRPTVHWSTRSERFPETKRKPTRRGMYTFLKLVYKALNPVSVTYPNWMFIYESSKFADEVASLYGFRIDRKAKEDDRVRVRFELRDPQSRDTLAKQKAWRWAENRYD